MFLIHNIGQKTDSVREASVSPRLNVIDAAALLLAQYMHGIVGAFALVKPQ